MHFISYAVIIFVLSSFFAILFIWYSSVTIVDNELVVRIESLQGIGSRVAEALAELANPESPARRAVEQLLPFVYVLDDGVVGARDSIKTITSSVINDRELKVREVQNDTVSGSDKKAPKAVATARPLEGKTVVFTGGMSHALCNRELNKQYTVALGGKVGSAVSGRTDILVVGDQTGKGPSSKMSAVREKYGDRVEVWSTEKWIEFLNQHNRL